LRSSNSKKRPPDVGNTRTGRPVWPKMRSSISRPSREEYHLWYSRFMRRGQLLQRQCEKRWSADNVTGDQGTEGQGTQPIESGIQREPEHGIHRPLPGG